MPDLSGVMALTSCFQSITPSPIVGRTPFITRPIGPVMSAR
jgi:hypothetical protein